AKIPCGRLPISIASALKSGRLLARAATLMAGILAISTEVVSARTPMDSFLTEGLIAVFQAPFNRPERQVPEEEFAVTNKRLNIELYRPLTDTRSANMDAASCEAVQILFRGRGRLGRGAREAFDRFPEIESISL